MRTHRRFVGTLAVIMMAALSAPGTAQEYRTDPIDDKAVSNRITVDRVVKGSETYDAQKANVNAFFTKYYFPAMTRTGPEDLANLGKMRYDLFDRYLRRTNNEQLQRDITQMAYRALGPIAVRTNPTYHPAARYNAVLVIGLLDEQYAIEQGANRRPPKPLLEATEFLTKIIANPDNPVVTPALVVGAFVGLERHAQYREAIPPETLNKMIDAALKMARREEPLDDVSLEVFRWIRLQAARTLAKLGIVGPEGKIHEALLALVGDSKLGVDNRCAVASQLANIKYEGATVDGQSTADRMFSLARDLSTDEKRRAKEFEDIRIGVSAGGTRSLYGGMREGGGYGGGYGEQVKFERRQVLARATDLRAGLRTIRPVVPAEAQAKIDTILPTIEAVINTAIDDDTVDLAVTETVRTMTNTIDSTIAPAAEPEDEAALFEEPAAVEEEAPTEGPAAAAGDAGPQPPAEAPPAEAPAVEAPAQ
jgi:hypothetical protein